MRVVIGVVSVLALSLAATAAPKGGAEREVSPLEGNRWTMTGEDPAYPREVYLVGKGYAVKSAEEAKRKAIAEVEKQITAMIKSVDKKQKREMKSREESWEWEDYSHFSRIRSSGRLEGVEVVHEVRLSDGYYALAVLDRSGFALRTASEISSLEEEIVAALNGAEGWIKKNNLSAALAQLDGVRGKMVRRDELRSRLSAVDPSGAAALRLTSQADLEKWGGVIAAEIEVKLISGAGQTIDQGMLLPQPVLLAVTRGGVPVPQVPLALVSDDGKRVLETRLTDSEGRVEWQPVGHLSAKPGAARLRVGVRLPVDAAWRKVLTERDVMIPYTVKSQSISIRVAFEGEKVLKEAVVERLGKIGIGENRSADPQLRIRQAKKEMARLQGLRNEMLQMELTTIAELTDGRNSVVAACTVAAKGYGASEAEALKAAVSATRWEKVAAMVRTGQGAAEAVPRVSIALMPGEEKGGERTTAALNDLLLGDLVNSGRFVVVERYRLSDVMAEQGLAAVGAAESSVEMGRLVGAERLLYTSLREVRGEWVGQARIVDVESGRVVSTAEATQPVRNGLHSLARLLSTRLNP